MINKTGRHLVGIGALMTALLSSSASYADDTIQYKGVSLTLGGFLAAEGVYRSRGEGADIASSYSAIPFSNSPVGHTSETRFTARQSRLSLLVQGDVDPETHLAFYSEFDFLGGAQTANSNESNSYNLRIRNLYGTVDWDDLGLEVLAGQSWSLVTMNSHGISPRNEVPPAVIDAQYVPGFTWARQPQVRITKNWNHEFWLAFSIENPQTTIQSGAGAASGVTVTSITPGGSGFDKANNLSLNHIPDIVGKVAWEPHIGSAQPLHLELFGIYRSYYDRVNIAAVNAGGFTPGVGNSSTSGGGFGAGVTWTVVPKLLDLQGSVMTGQGIGRYGSAQLPDVTLRPDGELAPIQETMFLGGATLHLGPTFDLYGYGGQEQEDRKAFNLGAAHFGLGNPSLNVAGCFIEGGSCSANIQSIDQGTAGFWWKIYQGTFGRFQVGMQYSYTHLDAFPGLGGKPQTDDNMVFTSIRYYPF